MTSDEIKAARIHAVTASKLCEMYGMVAGNTYREHQGEVYPKGFPQNLWVGVSVEDSSRLKRIGQLRHVKAALRWVSFEPLLQPIDAVYLHGIDWVIIGCETGPGRRPMDLAWAEELAASAKQQGVPVFLKGLNIDGNVVKDPAHPQWPAWAVRQWPQERQEER